MIYFIQQGDDGPIKIGYVYGEDAALRLRDLQVGNPEPLHISALMWGDIHTERALHARFAEGRLMGEWFRRDTPGLQELITEAIGLEYLLYAEHARRCVQCGRPYDSLRTKLCSDECERQRKIETSRRWRRNRRAELST